MAFPLISSSMLSLHVHLLLATASILLFVSGIFLLVFWRPKAYQNAIAELSSYCKFFYVSFLKPHTGDGLDGQQGALESFYKAQVRSCAFIHWQLIDGTKPTGRYLRCDSNTAPSRS